MIRIGSNVISRSGREYIVMDINYDNVAPLYLVEQWENGKMIARTWVTGDQIKEK